MSPKGADTEGSLSDDSERDEQRTLEEVTR